MAQAYFSLVTTTGKIKLAESAAGGDPVVITHFAIGDGNGAETNPTAASTALVREVWRTAVESVETDPDNPSAILVTAIIPTNAGGWWMREFGIFDQAGSMIAVAKPVSQYKPTALEGQLEDIRYEFQIIIGENANVTLLVDPSLTFATRAWVEARRIPMGQLMRLPWMPVVSMTLSSPPGSPAIGDCYLVPSNATGAWAANIGKIAEWSGSAWSYVTPPDGHGISLPDGRIFERTGGSYVQKLALDAQSGKWSYAVAGGTANALTADLTPVPAALTAGLSILLKITTPNNGAATLNVNGLGDKPIVNVFGAALSGGELTGLVRFEYDGALWWASVTTAGLTANRTFYVNAATGNDNNSGLTAGTAFATIQKAVNAVSLINLNGFTATISITDGTYADFISKPLTGSGNVIIVGNLVSPQNVQVNGAAGKNGFVILHPGYKVHGLSPLGNGSGAQNIGCAAPVEIGTMHHRAAPTNAAHIFAGIGSSITISGRQYIAGGAISHIYANNGGAVQSSTVSQPVMEFVSNSNFTEGVVLSANGSFVGVTYSDFINPGLAPGKKWTASVNGVINVNGAGINYYPGASAGGEVTGGRYV